MEQRVLKENELVMLSDDLGDIPQTRRRLGLYYRDTRYLSIFEISVSGHKPRHLASSCRQDCVCDIQLANPTFESRDGTTVLARSIGIVRSRFLTDGLHERITLYNYNSFSVHVDITLFLGGDFADIFEVRGYEREKRGTISKPLFSNSNLTFQYSGLDGINRTTNIVFDTVPSDVEINELSEILDKRPSTFLPESTDTIISTVIRPPCARVTWNLNIEPRKPLPLILHVYAIEGKADIEELHFEKGLALACERFQKWSDKCTKIETDNELFNRLLERSILDLRLLLERTPEGFITTAGIPWYSCSIGPVSLVTSLQTLMLNPQLAVHTLRHLAMHQGTKVDPVRDEEPGRIVHEIRKGEMARAKEIPHSAFYGSIDATPLFLLLFAETIKWLDDDDLYNEILPAARKALEWMLNYGDIDDDGYLEYHGKSKGGIGQKGWKDIRGILSYPDGAPVSYPVSLAEVQGYSYMAMQDMAHLFRRKGEDELASGLLDRASTLKKNFNRDFWLEDQRYFAQALDSQKNAVANITSSIGHCLFCGIIDDDKARYVITRLSSPEMSTGWGIRTVSNRASTYNPMSYYNGSVWPHDNSIIVAGMKRYGYHWEVEEISTQLFDASAFFAYHRFPELFGGFHRDREAYSIPAEYPASCSPHAWAAGSVFLLLQSLLGLRVDSSAKRIYLSPRLPNWLQYASVQNLRIGQKTVSLHFDRRSFDEETRFEISDNEAGVEVVIPSR
ncbi:MAG: amylo-alpha-1,6-glucosidase [Dehalococcoidia bacterium]|nr:amylo-alpha-1,6-glucosidase [Dehalococcoidia bacterium]